MAEQHDVINIKKALKARQLLAVFDTNLARLQAEGAGPDENEVNTLELLSEWLEEAIENGVEVEQLQSRASRLAHYALERGYTQHEVEALLTMRPNPNGRRLPNE
jgi:hypothetical protein